MLVERYPESLGGLSVGLHCHVVTDEADCKVRFNIPEADHDFVAEVSRETVGDLPVPLLLTDDGNRVCLVDEMPEPTEVWHGR
jgi:hypothetical protein